MLNVYYLPNVIPTILLEIWVNDPLISNKTSWILPNRFCCDVSSDCLELNKTNLSDYDDIFLYPDPHREHISYSTHIIRYSFYFHR